MPEIAAGRELDALVAHRVMGWRVTALNTSPYNGGDNEIRGLADSRIGGGCVIEHPEWNTSYYVSERWGIPAYSTDIATVWPIVAKYSLDLIQVDDGWMVGYFDGYTDEDGAVEGRMRRFSIADTAPLAICRAALKAVTEASA